MHRCGGLYFTGAGGRRTATPLYAKPLGQVVFTVLYCTVLYCDSSVWEILGAGSVYCNVLRYAVVYCAVVYCTILYCTALGRSVLYSTYLCCLALSCTRIYRYWPYFVTSSNIKHSTYQYEFSYWKYMYAYKYLYLYGIYLLNMWCWPRYTC